jgi:hypothetical protein
VCNSSATIPDCYSRSTPKYGQEAARYNPKITGARRSNVSANVKLKLCLKIYEKETNYENVLTQNKRYNYKQYHYS